MKHIRIFLAIAMAVLCFVGCAAGSGTPPSEPAAATTLPTTVSALYYDKFDTIDELFALDDLILVRAKPTEIAELTDTSVVFVMEIYESSVEGMTQIQLVQMRDPYQLQIGQEAVLVLKPFSSDENTYQIPNGGDGLFRLDESGSLSGELLESLLEDAPDASSDGSLDLETVYDLLAEKMP